MRWLAGTSGYSYKEWKGSFYPEGIRPDEMLSYYAGRLPAVEINNTFYRMPQKHVLEGWAAAVPEGFRFVLKASRRITHQARLGNIEEPVGYLVERAEVLGAKLGAVLFQLPPHFRKDVDRLQNLLRCWPRALPAALEFRHASWFDAETFDLLREHDVALGVSEDGSLPMPDVLATAGWLYLRLREPGYTAQKLQSWLNKGRASGAELGYVFFKHEDAGAGPALAEQFLSLAAKPVAKRAPRKEQPAKRAPRKAQPSSRRGAR